MHISLLANFMHSRPALLRASFRPQNLLHVQVPGQMAFTVTRNKESVRRGRKCKGERYRGQETACCQGQLIPLSSV